MSFLNALQELQTLGRIGGLSPKAWICVGPGFAREEIKSILLARGQGFTSEVVVNAQGLCTKIVAGREDLTQGKPIRVLGPLARQEVLRLLLAEPRISAELPELKRLKRQNTFFRKLERSLQSGRMTFAHEQEESVHLERLAQRVGPNPLRDEVRRLSLAYEAWLQGSGAWDPPLLMRMATEILKQGLPPGFKLPEEIVLFTAQMMESLELEFWELLGRYVKITRVGPLEPEADSMPAMETHWGWQRWHTLDDAAEGLAETLAELKSSPVDWDQHLVLLPDVPAIRRSIKRALDARGVPMSDPRDPTRLRWDESVKWALLPLEVVARNYDRKRVIAWLRGYLLQEELPAWIKEINARGIRNQLGSYSGGALSSVHSFLSELQRSLGGKKLCSELSEAHLTYLRAQLAGKAQELQWIVGFFEQTWKEFIEDMAAVGQDQRRAPALYWLERLQARLAEASPPVERVKPNVGVRVHRLGQAPLAPFRHLWFFGFPPHYFSGDGMGDYWYGEREREILSGEFQLRSGIQVRDERLKVLKSWVRQSASITFLDSHYDWDGRERETLASVLRELGVSVEPEEKGSHGRWSPSFSALRPTAATRVQLPPLSQFGVKEIRATDIDDYSRCSFLALGSKRWRVEDAKDPDVDLWPEAQGTLLHAAVRILLESRDEKGHFSKLPSEALDEAWALKRPKGLLRAQKLENYAKAKLIQTLEAFCEKEREYVQRSETKISSLEGPPLRLEFEDYAIIGIPDRIDEHKDGLFIVDFKTSSALPKGKEMLEMGYRLQLPFYALAAQKQLGKPAIGVQFVELNRDAGRSRGIFFKAFNGKEPGNLTNYTARNQSLVDVEPTQAWADTQEKLKAHADAYFQGRFEVKPKKSEDCRGCRVEDLCGRRRLGAVEEESGEGGGDG